MQTPRNSVNDKRDFNLWILVALSRRGAVPKPPGSRSLRHSLIFLFRFGVQLPRSFKICNNLLSKFPLERFDKRRFRANFFKDWPGLEVRGTQVPRTYNSLH